MRRRSSSNLPAAASVLLLLAAACKDEDRSPMGPGVSGLAPDFSLVDVNANSPTSGRALSPRRELLKISAWYFGHAT